MYLPFEKWHGCHNDFMVTWLVADDGMVLESLKRQAAHLCDRRGGVGGDGILVLHAPTKGDLLPGRLSIINSDGSIARTCGNGLRVAALSVLRRWLKDGNPKEPLEAVEFQVEGAHLGCQFLGKPGTTRSGRWPLVAVDMGTPKLNQKTPFYQAAKDELKRVVTETGVKGFNDVEVWACDIGNPHLVAFGQNFSRDQLLAVGPALQRSAHWDGINVHLVEAKAVTDKDKTQSGTLLGKGIEDCYMAWVWERGAGETQACGSGACVIGAAAMAGGNASYDEWLGVDMPGGRLFVKQSEEGEPVTLAGPGEFVFEGVVEV